MTINPKRPNPCSSSHQEASGGMSMDEEDELHLDADSYLTDTSRDYEAALTLFDLHKHPVGNDSRVDFDEDEIGPHNGSKKNPVRKKAIKTEEINNELIVEAFEGISGFEFVDPTTMWKKEGRKYRPMWMWEKWEEEHRKWVDSYMSKEANLEHQNKGMNKIYREPKDLLTRLYRFQKEWLSWALKQEETAIRGGILADEMGMGKTVETIALVLTKREIRSLSSSSLSSNSSEVNCTLIICPLSALLQWEREIERFTREGTTKVLCYHGSKRVTDSVQFSEYDFVITTYSTVERDYRSLLPKQRCIWCGKQLYEREMVYHMKHSCGPHVKKAEQYMHDRKRKKGCKHKKGGEEDIDDFEVDVRNPALHCVKWERIVLDEFGWVGGAMVLNLGRADNARHNLLCNKRDQAMITDSGIRLLMTFNTMGGAGHAVPKRFNAHCIHNICSNTARAIFALESSYKWALTGTPIQNNVGEFQSLIRFLQIAPFCCYFCKDCDCRVLDYSYTVLCTNCDHKASRHFCWWKKNMESPIESRVLREEGNRAKILLNHKILANILLRRTKSERALDLALPTRIISVRRDTLDIKEEDFYQSLHKDCQTKFNTYVESGTLTSSHARHILTGVRQTVNHPYLVVHSKSNSLRNENIIETDNGEQTCAICLDPVEDHVVASCGHDFCKVCLLDFISTLKEPLCPSCSRPLTADVTSKSGTGSQKTKSMVNGFRSSSIMNRVRVDGFQTSTKIDALREEIRFMIERDGSAKGIVFSQFTSFLDLIMYSLQKSGVACVLLEGSMSINARDDAIKRFQEDPDCRIFLISLKAGGVALNLTIASHVFLMEPWWNTAAERQAMDRIHRIGQAKPMRILRLVIENTVEDRMLELQRKAQLFEGTVEESVGALSHLTEGDMRYLFGFNFHSQD